MYRLTGICKSNCFFQIVKIVDQGPLFTPIKEHNFLCLLDKLTCLCIDQLGCRICVSVLDHLPYYDWNYYQLACYYCYVWFLSALRKFLFDTAMLSIYIFVVIDRSYSYM